MSQAPRPLVDKAGAATHLGTTERHVAELVYKRSIPFVKVGKLVRFRPEDLDAWVLEHRTMTEDSVAAWHGMLTGGAGAGA